MTIDQLNKAFKLAMQELQSFRENVIKDLTILHQNHQELLQGLNASEFNLRAHQKVLNAMALEHEHALEKLTGVMEPGQGAELCTLNMATLDIPQEDAPPKSVRRIDWPYYHKQVEKDLKILAEHEAAVKAEREEEERLARKASAERQKKLVESCDRLREVSTEMSLKDLADRIEKGEQILKDEDLKEFELTDGERSMVVSRLREGPIETEAKEEAPEAEVPEEPPQDESQEESEFPEGAQIFGG